MDALISRASGTTRSANFVACSSFQTVPAPSIASGIVGALIAGERSAPRNRLRVMTVTVGALAAACAAAGLHSAASAATANTIFLDITGI